VRIGRGMKTMVLCFGWFEVEVLEEGRMGDDEVLIVR
jgi:hypothetical protein